MDFLEASVRRRSVRKDREEEGPAELLDQVLDGARWAPSGGDIQPWEVIVVRDPETRKALQETLGAYNPARKVVLNAPVLPVLCGKMKIPNA